MPDLPTGRPAGRPRRYDPRTSTGIRLPPELHDQLMTIAEERDVSLNWVIVKLLTEGIEHVVPATEIRLTRSDRDA